MKTCPTQSSSAAMNIYVLHFNSKRNEENYWSNIVALLLKYTCNKTYLLFLIWYKWNWMYLQLDLTGWSVMEKMVLKYCSSMDHKYKEKMWGTWKLGQNPEKKNTKVHRRCQAVGHKDAGCTLRLWPSFPTQWILNTVRLSWPKRMKQPINIKETWNLLVKFFSGTFWMFYSPRWTALICSVSVQYLLYAHIEHHSYT